MNEILKRWNAASHFEWEESSSGCGVCSEQFSSGDVLFVYGDLEHAIARRAYVCVRCGIVALSESDGLKPAAAMVFVQESHRNVRLEHLSKAVREKVIDGFRMLDELESGVKREAEKGGR